MKVLLAGLPGSGKTTQARMLAKDLGLSFIQFGDILREKASSETELGEKIKSKVEVGELVDDEIVAEIIKERLANKDCKPGFIVDGYPRSVIQINMYDPGYDKVIYLNVSEEVVVTRMLSRGRHDDHPEVVKIRIRAQKQKMEELMEYYRSQPGFIEINGNRSIDQIYQDIKQHFNVS